MKKVLIVNNNMKIGGVQKSLCNLLWSVADQYDITLLLFEPVGEYVKDIPQQVHILSCDSLFRYLGISQKECSRNLYDYFIRGILAFLCKLFGRKAIMPLLLRSQPQLPMHYDCAISYLQDGDPHHFYGGVNEFVLKRVIARRKIAFLHCDYMQCGANCEENNKSYTEFNLIAACSTGCRDSFLRALPELAEKCKTVPNFHRYDKIRSLAKEQPYQYALGQFHIIMVGRLAHEKGIDRAIRAVAFARECGFPAILHLVGNGPKENDLRNMVCALGLNDAVIFHGNQNNPYRFMYSADLLLLTSLHEAAPMVIDEACALSLPTLTVRTTSSKEMVAKRGCGWICENNQVSLNMALTSVLNNPDSIQAVKKHLLSTPVSNKNASVAFAELIENNYD